MMKTQIYLLAISGVILAMLLSATAENISRKDLVRKILDVSGLEGDAYLRGRMELEGICKNNEKLFDEVINSSLDWRVLVLGGIVKERVKKGDQIKKFVETRMSYSNTREWAQKNVDVAKGLASHGKKTPMVLVEKIWKNNELNNWPLCTADGYASVCKAIGYMNMTNACPILENVLTNGQYFASRPEIAKSKTDPVFAVSLVRGSAAGALGNFQDPHSVPLLLSVYEKELTSEDATARAGAWGALEKCLDKDSLKYVEDKINATSDKRLKEYLQQLIKKYKDRVAAESKPSKIDIMRIWRKYFP